VRVLWVENHAVFVRMAGRQFLAAHDLTVVPSVAGAVAALTAQGFDAVLVDYDLDDGKGAEVVWFARRLPVPPAVVAVSSHADGNAALLAAGAHAACPKTQFAGIEGVLRSLVVGARPAAPDGMLSTGDSGVHPAGGGSTGDPRWPDEPFPSGETVPLSETGSRHRSAMPTAGHPGRSRPFPSTSSTVRRPRRAAMHLGRVRVRRNPRPLDLNGRLQESAPPRTPLSPCQMRHPHGMSVS